MPNTSLIVSIVKKGWANTVLQASIKAGAQGGTVFYGRGIGVNEKDTIFGIPIEPEKEVVFTLVETSLSDGILDAIVEAAELDEPGHGMAFIVAVSKVVGIVHAPKDKE